MQRQSDTVRSSQCYKNIVLYTVRFCPQPNNIISILIEDFLGDQERYRRVRIDKTFVI